jgi:hypothetical protein
MQALRFQGNFKVSIRYLIAEIYTEIRTDDAFIALQKALELGLKKHGFTDSGTFDYVLEVMMSEPERKWFEIKRVA